MLCDDPIERWSVEHVDHLAFIGNLLRRSIIIGFDGNDIMPEPFESDDEFLAKFAGAEEKYFFHLYYGLSGKNTKEPLSFI